MDILLLKYTLDAGFDFYVIAKSLKVFTFSLCQFCLFFFYKMSNDTNLINEPQINDMITKTV